ncbi:MAG: Holliday junction resolvase RuvX [Desulfovibrionales bacterium]|jgi:putative Holliday junction resolvase|nr:Holliday junction resolvase RuvX [Desulfovibrionales bacterium]
MKLLGIDYGQKRIGLAITQGKMAFPFKTLYKTTREKMFDELLNIITAEHIETIVLGWPQDLQGETTLTTRQVANFQQSLARRTSVPIVLINEALTSVEARQRLHEAGVSTRKHKDILDQMAAVCILESYLQNPCPGQ